MSAPRVTRGARRFVAASVLFFLGFQVAMAVGATRRTVVVLGLYGFVLHVLFGKAYALVPTYFERVLAVPWAPHVQLPLSVAGTLALAGAQVGPSWLGTAGALCWGLGTAVFLGTVGWTIRDNLTGAATGTGGANAHREPVDRLANAVLPVALLYLAAATVAVVLPAVGSSWLVPAQISHLLAAGTAALFVFGVGLRLFPRFLVTRPPRTLVWLVLPTGAVAPLLLAGGLFERQLLLAGGLFEAVAIVGFAVTYAVLFVRSDRRRVGFYAVLAAGGFGVVGVALALIAVLAGRDAALVGAHFRAMLAGFLGLTVVGATFQFYPPTVGRSALSSDRTALLAIGLLVVGLGGQILGVLGGISELAAAGGLCGVAGAGLYGWLLLAAFRRQS